MNIDSLKKQLQSSAYKDLKEYLLSKIINFDALHNVKELDDPVAQSIEIKAHRKTSAILKEILDELGLIKEQKEINLQDKIKQNKEELGI